MAAQEDSSPVIDHDSFDYDTGKLMIDVCYKCNFDEHICPGCGTPLTHSGHELMSTDPITKHKTWRLHGTRCVD